MRLDNDFILDTLATSVYSLKDGDNGFETFLDVSLAYGSLCHSYTSTGDTFILTELQGLVTTVINIVADTRVISFEEAAHQVLKSYEGVTQFCAPFQDTGISVIIPIGTLTSTVLFCHQEELYDEYVEAVIGIGGIALAGMESISNARG